MKKPFGGGEVVNTLDAKQFDRFHVIERVVEEQAHRITELESEMETERKYSLVSIFLNVFNSCLLMFGLLHDKLFEAFFNLFWLNAGFLKKGVDFIINI